MGDTDGSDMGVKEGRALDAAVDAVRARALALWALCGAVTAASRVVANVHWWVLLGIRCPILCACETLAARRTRCVI